MYDGRVGRWMTIDPEDQYQSPYLAMGNNPINGVDPTGGKFIIRGSAPFKFFVRKQLAILSQTIIGSQVIAALEKSDKRIIIDQVIKSGLSRSLAKYDEKRNTLYFPLDNNIMLSPLDWTPAYIPLGHEIYHAYLDVIFFEDNDAFQQSHFDAGRKDAIHERPAMAFENYIRKSFGYSISTRYKFKEGGISTQNLYKRFGYDPLFFEKINFEEFYENEMLNLQFNIKHFQAIFPTNQSSQMREIEKTIPLGKPPRA